MKEFLIYFLVFTFIIPFHTTTATTDCSSYLEHEGFQDLELFYNVLDTKLIRELEGRIKVNRSIPLEIVYYDLQVLDEKLGYFMINIGTSRSKKKWIATGYYINKTLLLHAIHPYTTIKK